MLSHSRNANLGESPVFVAMGGDGGTNTSGGGEAEEYFWYLPGCGSNSAPAEFSTSKPMLHMASTSFAITPMWRDFYFTQDSRCMLFLASCGFWQGITKVLQVSETKRCLFARVKSPVDLTSSENTSGGVELLSHRRRSLWEFWRRAKHRGVSLHWTMVAKPSGTWPSQGHLGMPMVSTIALHQSSCTRRTIISFKASIVLFVRASRSLRYSQRWKHETAPNTKDPPGGRSVATLQYSPEGGFWMKGFHQGAEASGLHNGPCQANRVQDYDLLPPSPCCGL
ncbi:hypothetical protein BXZ70DRAFT_1057326 [Cristinia sonorae]|uniref:Uncharacterized protein n=1 Tax=Cristinia sonorae TaxID=1940300 RepID=A0A8K0UUK6_9AGAR|nr:hypothetical protein BXZ70DRAFT_1057326 [Cristinia sonorae]